MQNDAIKRVETMREKARASAGLDVSQSQHGVSTAQEPRRIPMPKGYLEKKDTNEEKTEAIKSSLPLKMQESLGNINIDSDKALILSLVMLLSEENADELLIMALLYMLT